MYDPILTQNAGLLAKKKNACDDVLLSLIEESAFVFLKSVDSDVQPDDVMAYFTEHFSVFSILSKEFSCFCCSVIKNAKNKVKIYSLDVEENQKNENSRIAFMENNSSIIAFRRFAVHSGTQTSQYCNSFREITEELLNSTSDYGILPVRSTNDGYLHVFLQMIKHNDLKIIAETTVETEQDNQTCYALLARSLILPEKQELLRLYLSFVFDDSNVFSAFISSLNPFEMKIIAVESTYLSSNNTEFHYDIEFECSRETIPAFFLLLEAVRIRFEILGIFPVI